MLSKSLLSIITFIIFINFSSPKKNDYLKNEIDKLTFDKIIPEPTFHNLKMIGSVGQYGIEGDKETRINGTLLRALRFKNITSKIENKYNLPENILLAMIIQESGGADLLTNGRNDGGAGLCHMQPSVSNQFGLKVYKDSKKLVDKKHGKDLNKLIKKYKYDRKKLIQFDDRFHPIKNLDAAARILKYYSFEKKFKLKDIVDRGIRGYSGSKNYKKYRANLKYFQRKLSDSSLLKNLETKFNSQNKNLIIKIPFDSLSQHYSESTIINDSIGAINHLYTYKNYNLYIKKYIEYKNSTGTDSLYKDLLIYINSDSISNKDLPPFKVDTIKNKIFVSLKGDFKTYIQTHQMQNINYGLNKYN